MANHNAPKRLGKGFYIALALCLLLTGGIAGYAALSTPPLPAKDAGAPVQVPQRPAPKPRPARPLPPEEPEEPAEPAEEAIAPEELVPQVVSPLDGSTVTVFSMTELLYDETMADWRTHNGVDIRAAEGDAVKTAASGTVTSVRDDELMGTTVLIEHADGYLTQYSSLMARPPVEEGQTVTAGDTIGYVGTTAAAESSMGPHLHFSVMKDGQVVDPAEYVG